MNNILGNKFIQELLPIALICQSKAPKVLMQSDLPLGLRSSAKKGTVISSIQADDLISTLPYVTKWIKSCLLPCFGTFKMPFLMFISILEFRPECQIWNPERRDTNIYIRRILNASRINKLN